MVDLLASGAYVVVSSQTCSVRDPCWKGFSKLGMDYRDYVAQNLKYRWPQKSLYLRGDATFTSCETNFLRLSEEQREGKCQQRQK